MGMGMRFALLASLALFAACTSTSTPTVAPTLMSPTPSATPDPSAYVPVNDGVTLVPTDVPISDGPTLDLADAPSPTPTASISFVPQSTPTVSTSAENLMTAIEGTATLPAFTITSTLCSDQRGPDCTSLRLGDDFLTTSLPANGYLYSCNGANPNAPGATESKITWIDFSAKTWDFFKKLWLPKGAFDPDAGAYAETITGDQRLISINGLPVDGLIGDWPMTNYPELTGIDRNPGIPAPRDRSFTYPISPQENPVPNCVPQGAIGVTTNGVAIYNAVDGRGEDAVAREIVDVFGGHPAQSDYHYHFIPERLDNISLSDGHSDIVGYINDGFAIYGYRGQGGIEMSNKDLDLCHGHSHDDLGYHYHATIEYPYTVGCYKGNSTGSSVSGGGVLSTTDLPPRRPLRPRR